MDFIDELIYSAHMARTNKSVKDKRQKNKYYRSTLLENKELENEELENEDELPNSEDSTKPTMEVSPTITQEERRSKNDRRQSKLSRGRYIESRQRINRRNNNDDVDIKI